MVSLGSCTRVHVERDAELLERVLDHLVVAIHHILWRDAFLASSHSHGHAVLIRSADKHHFLAFQTEVAHVDVSRNIHAGQVSDMHTAVSVGQCRSHGSALEFLVLFHCLFSIWVQN